MLKKLIVLTLFCCSFILAEDNSTRKSCKLHYDYFPEEGSCENDCPSLWEYNAYYTQGLFICGPRTDGTGFIYCCSNPSSGTVKWEYKENETRVERISEKKCWEQHYTEIPDNRFISEIITLPEEFPHFSIIGWEDGNGMYDFKCTGSLIAPDFVLTSAHCANANGKEPSVVKVGGTSFTNESAELLPIIKTFTHPDYNNESVYHDISLIQLGTNSSNLIACLWQTDATYHYKATALGYGEAAGNGPKNLIKGNLTIFTNDYCKKYYSPSEQYLDGVIDSQICIGDSEGKQVTCKGDSGGPIEVKIIRSLNQVPVILGVDSFGKDCGPSENPRVYTRISSYLDWIESIVWPNE